MGHEVEYLYSHLRWWSHYIDHDTDGIRIMFCKSHCTVLVYNVICGYDVNGWHDNGCHVNGRMASDEMQEKFLVS